jgi:hypothetical protein
MSNLYIIYEAIKYFILGFKVDSQHIFNTGKIKHNINILIGYFIVSLFAVFYS